MINKCLKKKRKINYKAPTKINLQNKGRCKYKTKLKILIF